MKKMKLCEVVKAIEEAVPPALQEEWDNSGLTVGFENREIGSILTCLEVTEEVVEECMNTGADMIVTHHPFIFSGIKEICDETARGKMTIDLIKEGICVYSCHTPFDKVKGGNNDSAARRLGLEHIKNLEGHAVRNASSMISAPDPADIGRSGSFREPVTFREAIETVLKSFEISLMQVRAAGDLERELSRVGICTGAGADFIAAAADAGCELFITGDVKYHEAQMAEELGICIIDAGHYGTEKFFGRDMKALLDDRLSGKVRVTASQVNADPFLAL